MQEYINTKHFHVHVAQTADRRVNCNRAYTRDDHRDNRSERWSRRRSPRVYAL